MSTNCIFRVSTTSTLAAGDVKQIATGLVPDVDITGQTFTKAVTGNVWVGIVGTGSTTGQYCEITDALSIIML
jgi:hypothetical protein